MKKLIFAIIFGVSSAAMASGPVVVARKTECAEIQRLLNAEGSIEVKSGLGWTLTHFSTSDRCTAGTVAGASFVRAKDKWFCKTGYTCNTIPDTSGGGGN